MNIYKYLNKPEYIFRPYQLYRRMMRHVKGSDEFEIVTLPWKVIIKVRPNETIGRSIVKMEVYDLIVTEVLWRLIEPSEVTIDVGANIGYMTSVMAKRVGQSGKVYSYEPHPEIFEELNENIRIWRETYGWNQIESRNIALSNDTRDGILNVPPHFKENRGVASLMNVTREQNVNNLRQYPIALAKLDELMNVQSSIGAIKIDVEGHELEVLQGGAKVVKDYVRDILFEEHGGYPSRVSCFLENCGFTIFRMYKEIRGPRVEPATENPRVNILPWEPPSYLATKEPLRVVERMKRRGWQSLSGQ